MTAKRFAGTAILALTVLGALEPLVGGAEEVSVPQHHLLHAVLVVGAVISGVLLCSPRAGSKQRAGWIVAAFIAPICMMVLMWPSDFSFFEMHPWGHALEHAGIVVAAFFGAYAGQRFSPGVGWVSGGSAILMSLLAAAGFGVAPKSTVPVAAASAQVSTGATSLARGATIFAQDCTACHGVAGIGASGPSLKNERTRKDLQQTIVWIEHPAPPMPAFYPQTLSAADVAAVAAYVQKL